MRKPLLFACLMASATSAFAGDLRITATGVVVAIPGTPPPSLASTSIGDPVTVIYEVFDPAAVVTPFSAQYDVDYAMSSLQVGPAIIPMLQAGMVVPGGTLTNDLLGVGDSFSVIADLPGGAYRIGAFFTDPSGASLSSLDLAAQVGPVIIPMTSTSGLGIVDNSTNSAAIAATFGSLLIEVSTGGGFGSTFCMSLPNSSGMTATLTGAGSTSVAAQSLSLTAANMPANVNGIFYYGTNQASAPFGNGTRCVAGAVQRLPFNSASPGGVMSEPDVFSQPMNNLAIAPGTLNFQAWFRDAPGGGAGFNLSNGLAVTFVP